MLDEDHYGLEKVKERVLEYLAVTALSERPKGPIMCLVGPPGVGKTSLARSVAKATGRQFARISLGGVRDEAEIRGHRRTYIGAMPGKIINALKKAGTSNPIILLDEIDKMSSDFRGDPASAMLEVLDPEQNHTFNDHYLDMDYDLSQVLFLATANTVHSIPRPLLDRMELISLSGYTELEKKAIARQYLIPKCVKFNGLEKVDMEWDDSSLEALIRFYTREAGVRNLEREISSVSRKIARELLKRKIETDPDMGERLEKAREMRKHSGEKPATPDQEAVEVVAGNAPIISLEGMKANKVDGALIEKYIGPHRYSIGEAASRNEVGVCQGLAYTEVGGELLIVEVAVLPGKGNLKVTGKLGEVMQESAQAAFTYIRSRAEFLGLETDFYSKIDIHVHFPEGAIPKDGPSAGITMATALASALTKRPVCRDIAMTGEITLRGRVLPIGGLKEKLLAAHRAGVKRVLVPRENIKDLYDAPKKVLAEIEIIPVDHVDSVLMYALAWPVDDDLHAKLRDAHQAVIAQSAGAPQEAVRH